MPNASSRKNSAPFPIPHTPKTISRTLPASRTWPAPKPATASPNGCATNTAATASTPKSSATASGSAAPRNQAGTRRARQKKSSPRLSSPSNGTRAPTIPRLVGFNAYSPSGDVTAPVVYVNYGTQEDYRQLESLGISVAGKIAIARYGGCYRGIKSKLAEEHKAVGASHLFRSSRRRLRCRRRLPRGPWRPMSGIQRGSILYTEIYPGDPLTPGVAATPDAKRLAPADATKPSAHSHYAHQRAGRLRDPLASLGGEHVPRAWQGGLPFTYHIGPGDSRRSHEAGDGLSAAPDLRRHREICSAPMTPNGSSSAIITTRGCSAPSIPAAAPRPCSKPRARSANWSAADGNRAAPS